MAVDLYRVISKGHYYNDFGFLNYDSHFPNDEILGRNAVYKFRAKQLSGEYNKNKRLLVKVNGVERELPYKVLSINYFKLIVDKTADIIFNNEVSVKTGDIYRDTQILKLMERTNFVSSIRRAFKICNTYGDAGLKVHKDGVSAFKPTNIFKVVDNNDISKVKGYVLYQPFYVKDGNINNIKYIRFEIHFKGRVYECVREYNGGMYGGFIGHPVEYAYNGRVIHKSGNWYDTGVYDCELVSMPCINQEIDGVYGESVFNSVQDIVFAIEQRVSVNQYLLDDSMMPFIVLGANAVRREITKDGEERLKVKIVDGRFLVDEAGDNNTKVIDCDFNLTNSENMLGILKELLYELSEMGKTYLSGEYSGNISEETLNNTIKSAIDKANRYLTEQYHYYRDALYCLCRLNGIEICKEDITIVFNIGRTDDDKTVAEICKTLVDSGILSKTSVRERYFGYSKEQSETEQFLINKENGLVTEQVIDDIEQNS